MSHWDHLTIWSITPAVTPPAILKAAGKFSRPAPKAAFTTMKTAPKDDTPPLLLSEARCWTESTLGLCKSHARSPASWLPSAPQSSPSVLMAMRKQSVQYLRLKSLTHSKNVVSDFLNPGWGKADYNVWAKNTDCSASSATVRRQLMFFEVISSVSGILEPFADLYKNSGFI